MQAHWCCFSDTTTQFNKGPAMQYSINVYPSKVAPLDFREHVEEQSFVPHRFGIFTAPPLVEMVPKGTRHQGSWISSGATGEEAELSSDERSTAAAMARC